MWVTNGESAVNVDRVNRLFLRQLKGSAELIAKFDSGDEAVIASGALEEMFDLLEAIVYEHEYSERTVFDIESWRRKRDLEVQQ